MFQPESRLTVENAASILSDGVQAIAGGQAQIDLGRLTVVDSSAVATLLEWRREAHQQGKPLSFVNSPASLRTLAELYGVDELLQL